ncbi:hypothetical protein [Massilia pseudoviolaceinigra]|uniref:hypothetical protein n=1 Tax=Massilia pseudoviolaceinigra TaxID=3057165 RepID=UPI00279696B5|nr:hypothetical protein [Massilia sp. CCM 9206]MDQ1924792.1 hypothetical protein [Massilia sp. CCM 9206]
MRVEVVVFACGLYTLVSIWATIMVIADEFSNRWQKAAQLALVWCVPILGPLVVFGVHRKAEKPSGKYRQDVDAGEDYGRSGADD